MEMRKRKRWKKDWREKGSQKKAMTREKEQKKIRGKEKKDIHFLSSSFSLFFTETIKEELTLLSDTVCQTVWNVSQFHLIYIYLMSNPSKICLGFTKPPQCFRPSCARSELSHCSLFLLFLHLFVETHTQRSRNSRWGLQLEVYAALICLRRGERAGDDVFSDLLCSSCLSQEV